MRSLETAAQLIARIRADNAKLREQGAASVLKSQEDMAERRRRLDQARSRVKEASPPDSR